MAETYKFIHEKYKTKPDKLFSSPPINLRGHSKKLFKQRTNTSVAQNFFKHRVVDSWNALPADLIAVPNVELFKKKLRSLSEDIE